MRASLACAAVVALACAAPVLGGEFGGETRIRSLGRYFSQVLDHDGDGRFSLREHQAHLESLDPESYPTLSLEFTNGWHTRLDLDADEQVTLAELCRVLDICTEEEAHPDRLEAILAHTSNEPVQVHLAATTTYGEMIVNWAQAITDLANAEVRWGTEPGQYSNGAQATYQTYSVSLYGLKYTSLPLFNASMTGLAPLTRYYYVVGSPNDGFSPEQSFVSLPDSSVPATQQNITRMVVYGDQGTIIPMGATVCKWVEAEQAQNPFNALLHVGDLAYAGVSHKMGEYEPTWDTWMQQISGIGAQMPYMTSVGNHENFFNYASYLARFNMPGPASGGNTSFWWSFDLGSVHVTSFSSESDYNPGSVQYSWIEADFAAARANPNTKWLVFAGHRPFYSSDQDELDQHVPGAPMLVALEPLLNKYAVDMVLTGHEHMYERTWPVNNGTVFNATAPGACQGVKDHELGMVNEKKAFWDEIDSSLPLHVFDKDVAAEATAPIYIVQATAGIFQNEMVVEPQPVWSASRLVGTYGYGVLSVSTTASGCSSLLYQFRTNVNGAIQVIDQVLLTHQVTATGKPEKESIFIAEM